MSSAETVRGTSAGSLAVVLLGFGTAGLVLSAIMGTALSQDQVAWGFVFATPVPAAGLAAGLVFHIAPRPRRVSAIALIMGVAVGAWLGTMMPTLGCTPAAENVSLIGPAAAFGAVTTCAILVGGLGVPAVTGRCPFISRSPVLAAAVGLIVVSTGYVAVAALVLPPLSCLVALS